MDSKPFDMARIHDLTIEEIKACSLFADLTDEQAKEIIDCIKQFTLIAFDAMQRAKKVNNMKNALPENKIS